LYHGRGSPNFRFRQKQVNMFRHHDIPDDHEAITLASVPESLGKCPGCVRCAATVTAGSKSK
jgi:hypothetical protein